MTAVATFDQTQLLQVEQQAAQHLRRFVERGNAAGIRLAVKDSGCSGYAYVMDTVTEAPAEAIALTVDGGLQLFIDRKSAPVLAGCTLRLVKEGLNETIKFDNPNAGSYCGCGESFTVSADVETRLQS